MAKWKCEVCGNEFENFHAQGFDNKIYCLLCYFKKENQKLKKQIEEERNKVREYSYKLSNFRCEETYVNQQKEFIEWLEAMSKMYENEYKDIDIAGHYNCVLSKYKEIIGVSDDKIN